VLRITDKMQASVNFYKLRFHYFAKLLRKNSVSSRLITLPGIFFQNFN